MTSEDDAPVRRRHVTLTNLAEAVALLGPRYAAASPAGPAEAGAFRLGVDSTAVDSVAGTFWIDRIEVAAGGRVETGPAPRFVLVVPRSGSWHLEVGGERSSALCVVPYWTSAVAEWDDLGATIVALDLEGVRRVGDGLVAADAPGIDFTGWRPLSSALARHVTSVVDHVERAVLADDEVLAHPLVRADAFRQLATAVLAAFPNTARTRVRPGAGRSEPATVRRAADFIDAHAREDIDVARIAEAARIGPRGLQAAFRKYRGETPLEYLRRVRMDGAHRDLEAADPTRGDTVSAVAAGWGFTHPGRFSVDYRRTYGHSPREALRR